MIRVFLLLLALGTIPMVANAQTPLRVRVCTYNVLNHGEHEDSIKVQSLATVVATISPNILVVQEINNDAGFQDFLMTVVSTLLEHPLVGVFRDGPDSDNALFYDTQIFELLADDAVTTELRDINRWTLLVRATGDTLNVFSLHLKAGDDIEDERQRASEASILRAYLDTLAQSQHRIVVGDLNVYTSTEAAYQTLTGSTLVPAGEVHDPLNRNGNWHNNPAFADVHTQSPRVTSFGGGANGGMDDRFDFILLSPSLLDGEFVPGSYTNLGNDGAHINDVITSAPNTAVTMQLAEALHQASDHLPVFLDLVFDAMNSGVDETKQGDETMQLTRVGKRD